MTSHSVLFSARRSAAFSAAARGAMASPGLRLGFAGWVRMIPSSMRARA